MFIIIWVLLQCTAYTPTWVLVIIGVIAILEAIQWIVVIAALGYSIIKAKTTKR